jgi:hypothetical protein
VRALEAACDQFIALADAADERRRRGVKELQIAKMALQQLLDDVDLSDAAPWDADA